MQSPGIDRFLQRLSPQLAQSFTADQLAAVELHYGMRYRVPHAVDWRMRLGFSFAKIYIVLLAGRERPNH